MTIDWAEVRKGLAEARPFLLSHHLPSEYDHCYAPVIRGQTVQLCARCTGIYPGILGGLVAFFVAPTMLRHVMIVAVLPLPALLDWSLTALGSRDGSNPVRTVTGALLGYGYGLGLGHLLVGRNVAVLLVGLCYGLLADVALTYHERKRR
jgi:uncharacterized membrane protein